MNLKELQFIINGPTSKGERLFQHWQAHVLLARFYDMPGVEHPLWALLNIYFPPKKLWKSLTGAERGQIRRAAEKLHEHNIPYPFYVAFLCKFEKGYLKKRSALTVTKYKVGRDGAVPILTEYLNMMNFLIKCFKEETSVITTNDNLYARFPEAYKLGILKYVYSVRTIWDAYKNHNPLEIMTILSRSKSITEFWDKIGTSVDASQTLPIDLSRGISRPDTLKVLQKEMRVRTGKEAGRPNPSLNKYFKKNGMLNVRGIRVISGEGTL